MDWKRLFGMGSTALPAVVQQAPSQLHGESIMAYSINDPFLIDFLREGYEAASGATVTVDAAMRNPTFYRAISLICYAIAMLPLHLIDDETKEKQSDHPLFKLLHRKPNSWQTAFDFRCLMQLRALVYGDAYALKVKTYDIRARRQVIKQLIPLDPLKVTIKQREDWSVYYEYQPANGQKRTFEAADIFHLRGLSLNGLNGISLVKQARDAIGLAMSAEMAAGRMFKNGSFIGGALKTSGKLSDTAFKRLQQSMAEKEGPENAGKNLILEEGLEYQSMSGSARDSELTDFRKMQIEETARVTGVPRPLLMVDETSWGSGISALGQFFVMYALNPWFEAWQQSVERSMLEEEEQGKLAVKFNPAALMRGSPKDQAEFFAKALGSGGGKGWMTPNEVRRLSDFPDDKNPVSNELSQGTATQPSPEGKPEDDEDAPPEGDGKGPAGGTPGPGQP